MVGMSRPTSANVPRTLLTIIRVFPRLLPRTALLLALIIGLMVAALGIAATLAAPSAEQVAQTLAQGTGTATLQLVLASAWWLVPLTVMFAALLTFTGVLLHFADAALSGRRVSGLTALAVVLGRIHVAALIAVVYAAAVIFAIIAAPLISLLALIAFVLTVVAARQERELPARMPTRRRAGLLIIPFFLAGAVVIRWSLAFGEVFLARAGWRESLRLSWQRTEGRVRHTGIVLVVAYGATFVIGWALMILGLLSGSIWVELSLQLASSLLLAPIPAITLLVLFRGVGGPVSPLAQSVADAPRMSHRRFGSSIPAAVSFALVLTLLTPPSAATASEGQGELPPAPPAPSQEVLEPPIAPDGDGSEAGEEPNAAPGAADPPEGVGATVEGEREPPVAGSFVVGQPHRDLSAHAFEGFSVTSLAATSVTLDHAAEIAWFWEFGTPTEPLTGEVVADGGESIPTGTVQLWGSVADPDRPSFTIGDAENLIGGLFDLDGRNVLPGTTTLWVEYSGDDDHAAGISDEQGVSVQGKVLWSSPVLVHPTGPATVGDRLVIRVEVDANGDAVPGQVPSGEFQLIDAAGSGSTLHTADVIDGFVTFDFVMTARSLHLALQAAGDTRYYYTLAGGEWVVGAEPAATSTTLSVQQEVSLGTDALAIALVHRPNGVPASGDVEFFFARGTSNTTTSLGSVAVVDGQAAMPFCVGTNTNGAHEAGCDAAPRAIVQPATDKIRVTAKFMPNPSNEYTRSLLPSVSSEQAIDVVPAGTTGSGTCKIVEIRNQAYKIPTASTVQRQGLGTPSLSSKTNCTMPYDPVAGHRDGTVLTVQARPAPGYELVEWRHDGAVIGTQPTLVWRIPEAPHKWTEVIEPVYQPVCLSFDARTRGSGTVTRAVPQDNSNPLAHQPSCTLKNGTRGAYLGTVLEVTTEGITNPLTAEMDVFAHATVNGTSLSHARVSFNANDRYPVMQHTFSVTMQRDIVVVVDYVPHCRTVQTDRSWFAEQRSYTAAGPPLTLAEGAQTGLPELLTAPNCSTSLGSGYLRNSEVSVRAQLDGPYQVVAGWRVNGHLVPSLGIDEQVNVVVQRDDVTTIEYDVAECYPVEATVHEPTFKGTRSASQVVVAPEPNCADGSDRYAAGTTVTLWPMRARATPGVIPPTFSGWKDDLLDAQGVKVGERLAVVGYENNAMWHAHDAEVIAGTMSKSGDRTVELTQPLVTTAYFYDPAVCSSISISGGSLYLADVRFGNDRCGPGRYFDAAKAQLPSDGIYRGHQYRSDCREYEISDDRRWDMAEEPMKKKYYDCDDFTYRYTTLKFEVPGTILDIYGTVSMSQKSPSSESWEWRGSDELNCFGAQCEVAVRGDVRINLSACQPLDIDVRLTVVGDESGKTYTPSDLGLSDFDWVVSETPGCSTDLAWSPGRKAVLRAQAPIVGMEFIDWTHVDNLVALELFTEQHPDDPRAPMAVHVRADDTEESMRIGLEFVVHCAKLNLGHTAGVIQPAPNCPGRTDGMNYMVGTFIEVAAAIRNTEGRRFVRFEDNTIIAETEGVS